MGEAMKLSFLLLACCLIGCSAEQAVATGADAAPHRVGGKTAEDVFEDLGLRALADAACVGDVEGVERALRQRTNANGLGLDGTTPLIWATSCGDAGGVKALLDGGADPNQPMNGIFPLMIAVDNRHHDVVELLVKNGADLNVDLDARGSVHPLHIAFRVGTITEDWRSYWYLIENGADIESVVSGRTVIEKAMLHAYVNIALDGLERGYDFRLERLADLAEWRSNRLVTEDSKQDLGAIIEILRERGYWD